MWTVSKLDHFMGEHGFAYSSQSRDMTPEDLIQDAEICTYLMLKKEVQILMIYLKGLKIT